MGTNIYSGMTSAQKENERKYLTNLQSSGNSGEKTWASNQLKQLNSASSSSSSTSSKTTSSSKSSSSKSSASNSNRYNTTVTKKNGTTASGYIEDGKSYYSDGTRISAGDSVVDAQGKVWTMGGSSDTNKNTYQLKDETNPYDAYAERLQKEYAKQQELIEEKNRLAVEQGVNRLNAQKTNINQSADDNARQAYVMYMQNKKALPQQLASQGATGGATETANLGLSSNYENNVNSINQNRTNSLQEIDNAITDLQNSGDLSTVEQVIANNEAALNAYKEAFNQKQSYNQWATEFNANRSDVADSINYRDKVYADQMAQQELENKWYEDTYSNSKKKEETNRVITLLQSGMVDVNYASTLLGVPIEQINSYVEYINKMRNLEMQSQQASINNTYSTINSRNESDENSLKSKRSEIFDTAFAMTKNSEYTAEDIKRYIWGHGLTDEEEFDMFNNLGLLDE